MNTSAPLNGITTETFLRDYWQKKPLCLRNALPAAAVAGIFGNCRAFAKTVFRGGENIAVIGNDQRYNLLFIRDLDATYADCITPHRSDIFFVKTNGLTTAGEQQHITFAVREFHANQLIVVTQLHRNDSGSTGS